MEFLYVLLIIFIVFGVSFLLINIRHLIVGEEFRGTCASANPKFQTDSGECSFCGSKPGETCKNEDEK